jgi:hypothetical protein
MHGIPRLAWILHSSRHGAARIAPGSDEEVAVNYTYYDYLEVAPGASRARIESAYQQLLERFGYGTTDAGQDMSGLVRMVHTAYQILSDPEERQKYDAELMREAAAADAELKAALDQPASWLPRRVQNVPAPLLRLVASAA